MNGAKRPFWGLFSQPATAREAAAELDNEVGRPADRLRQEAEEMEERRSVMSITTKAQDAAKMLFSAGYAALTVKEDLERDTREMNSPVGAHVDRANAKIMLESMSHSGIVFTVSVLYFAAVVSLFIAISVAVLTSQRTASLNVAAGSFAVEGIARTLAVLITLLTGLFFSTRVVRYAMRTRDGHILPEQLLLIVFILIIMCTPGMSVYSPYLFWQQFHNALEFTRNANVTEIPQGQVFSIYFFASINDGSTAVKIVSAVFSVIIISFSVIFFGMSTYFFGLPVERRSASQPDVERDVEAQNEHPDQERTDQVRTVCEALLMCGFDFHRLLINCNKRILGVSVIYLIVSLVVVSVFEYLPSQVPFVGMITILKVCPSTDQTPTVNASDSNNCAPGVNDGVPFARAMSVTAQFIMECIIAYYLHRQSIQTRLNLKRMPYEENRSKHLGFRYFSSNKRMTFFFISLSSIIVVSVMQNTFFIYAINRTGSQFAVTYDPLRQVGINFFGLGFGPFYLNLACFIFAVAKAYLPPDSAPGLAGFISGGHEASNERDVDHPEYIIKELDVAMLQRVRDDAKRRMLHERRRQKRRVNFVQQSRLSRSENGRAWVSRRPAFTNSNSPMQPDEPPLLSNPEQERSSHGPASDGAENDDDFDSEDEKEMEEAQREKLKREQQLKRVQDFFQGKARVMTVRDKYREQYKRLAALLKAKDVVDRKAVKARAMEMPLIAEQMNANLFCFETEILMLNLSFLAYCLGSGADVEPMKEEFKQELLGERCKLVSHIENLQTEIQAMVTVDALDERRIYVAFRGTSTSKNIWQDLDYAQVLHQSAHEVEPYLKSPEDLVARKAAYRTPKVHRGFYLAYLSIKEQVMDIVTRLIENRENCVVFACGHSLGGALATHFSFDLGMRYPVVRSKVLALQTTTFGSPRVGNYSFVARHMRVVPTTHRFCIGGDPVPKLPPARPLADFTKWGYFHVGVDILLDVERVNLLVGPLFIEKQIQHGWGGYVPKNHIMGSYMLALALWSANVHPDFVPEWSMSVINHVLKTERLRMKRILESKPQLTSSMQEQLYKEGAIIWTDDARALQTHGCDTSAALRMSIGAMNTEQVVNDIELGLAQCGILFKRKERASMLVEAGVSSLQQLSMVTKEDLQILALSYPELVTEDFAKLLLSGYSLLRCPTCGFAPLECPKCVEIKAAGDAVDQSVDLA